MGNFLDLKGLKKVIELADRRYGKKDELVVTATGSTSSTASASVTYNADTQELDFSFGLPQGPKGDKGDKGDTGSQGPVGSNGVRGYQGHQGPKGATGSDSTTRGYQGHQGPKGAAGSDSTTRGYQGHQGPKGATGSNGSDSTTRGYQGHQGPKGATGSNGSDSTTRGYQGHQGPKGATGSDSTTRGYQGHQGPKGATGSSLSATTGSATSSYYVIGASGTTGTYTVLNTLAGVQMCGTQLRASGGFYQSSDERLKIFKDDINIDFENLKQIPKKYFSWKNGDSSDNIIGTSAQIVQQYYPEIVSEDENGYLSVNYALLSIISLKAIDELYDRNLMLENKLKLIEESL